MDVCTVGRVRENVSEAVVAIADDVGVFAPGLAEVGARHEVGSDAIFDACAVLEAELEYATAVERGGVSEVEGSFDETDVLKAKREDTGGFFERSVGERDELEGWTGGDIGTPARLRFAEVVEEIVLELAGDETRAVGGECCLRRHHLRWDRRDQ